jgi:hypothetical protein
MIATVVGPPLLAFVWFFVTQPQYRLLSSQILFIAAAMLISVVVGCSEWRREPK